MKTARKAILAVMCVLCVIVASITGTLAYLTDTEAVTNTFTVGKVGLKLDEAVTNEYGETQGTNRTEDGNEYKLIPGHTYVKDPTVTVDADSEESYVRMIVTITDYADVKAVLGDDFLPQNFVNGWDSAKWISTGVIDEDTTADTASYEFRYYKTVNTLAVDDEDPQPLELEPLFTSFTLPGEVSNQPDDESTPTTPVLNWLDDMEILVEAHAIQADGFKENGTQTAEDVAWAAFDAQVNS